MLIGVFIILLWLVVIWFFNAKIALEEPLKTGVNIILVIILCLIIWKIFFGGGINLTL